MKFKTLAALTAGILILLAFVWMFAADFLLGQLQVPVTESALLVGRRMAALFLGLAVMFFIGQAAEPSVARTALSAGVIVACIVLAVLGLFELSAGRAGPFILSAVLVEVGLAIGFLVLLRNEHKASTAQG